MTDSLDQYNLWHNCSILQNLQNQIPTQLDTGYGKCDIELENMKGYKKWLQTKPQ